MAALFGHGIDAQRQCVQEETKKLNDVLRGLKGLRCLSDSLIDESPDILDLRKDLEFREKDLRRSLERERAILRAMETQAQPTQEAL